MNEIYLQRIRRILTSNIEQLTAAEAEGLRALIDEKEKRDAPEIEPDSSERDSRAAD